MKKIFKIQISPDDESGLNAVSLVEYPAVERNFLLFSSEENKNLELKFNEEKRLISGIAIEANKPIYRFSQSLGEYWVFFDEEVIRSIVEKYSKNNLLNSVNLEHNENNYTQDAIMVESYIIDKERGICPSEFSDVNNGSWFVTYKITSDELWNKIKNGEEFKGFSVEGLFELVEADSFNFSSEQKTNKLKELKSKIMNLSKISLRNLLLRFEDVQTDKGVITVDGAIEVGSAVYVNDEPAVDGDYALEDGRTLVVSEGKIAEIREPEEVKPEEEIIVEAEEEPAVKEPAEEETPEMKIAKLEARIAELLAENEELRAKLAEKDAEVVKKEEEIQMSVEKYMQAKKNANETKKSNLKSYLK